MMDDVLRGIFLGILLTIACGIVITVYKSMSKTDEIDEDSLYPVSIEDMPYPGEIVDTIVFPPHQATGYWNTKDKRLKVVIYTTDDGNEHEVILYNSRAKEIVEQIFEKQYHLITEVDVNGNHYAIHVIKPE